MRKILLLLTAVVAVFTACNNDEEPTRKTKGRLDPNAQVTISPAEGVQVRAIGDADSDTAFTALEVMLRAHGMYYHTEWSGQTKYNYEMYNGMGFGPNQKDTANAKLKFWGIAIIDQDGDLVKDLLYGRDFVIVGGDHRLPWPEYSMKKDTLAYIPESVVRNARQKIEQAYADSNFTEVYRLFDEAFTYIPCTAKQYKELKAKGLN